LQALRLPREQRFLLDIHSRPQPELRFHPTLSIASDAVNFTQLAYIWLPMLEKAQISQQTLLSPKIIKEHQALLMAGFYLWHLMKPLENLCGCYAPLQSLRA
jgi:hypothetical protein